jgi:predicted metal-dependent peptidase
MSLMTWTCPGFKHLFFKLLSNNDGGYYCVPSEDVPIAATDAKNIIINPGPFFARPLKQRVFATGHEIVHNMYGDVEFLARCTASGEVPMSDGSKLPFRNSTLQKAMDFRINALLVDSRIGELIPGCLYDETISKANESVVDVYKKVWDDEETNGGKKTGGNLIGHILAPGVSTGGNPAPRNQQQWQIEVSAAQKLEAMRGDTPGSLKRLFQEIIQPEVPWTEHIRGIFNRRVGSGSYNWRRPDRRFIARDLHMPSRSGHGAGWIVVWGDTSGSIGRPQMEKYLGELSGIIEDVRPKRLTVIWCDAKIHHVDEVQDATDLCMIKARGVDGGGGTSVMPVFDWIADSHSEPDMFVGFTDCEVTFPDKSPPYPCIWACVSKTQEAPWGELIRIPVKA